MAAHLRLAHDTAPTERAALSLSERFDHIAREARDLARDAARAPDQLAIPPRLVLALSRLADTLETRAAYTLLNGGAADLSDVA